MTTRQRGIAHRYRELTPTQLRIAEAASELDSPMGPDDLGFLHSILAQCSLPYREPKNARDYVRENGRASIIVSAGHAMDPQTGRAVLQGLPYGAKPRLILLHLCTEAIRTQSPQVSIHDSVTKFMHVLGFKSSGGHNGSIWRFKDQLTRLAASRIQLIYHHEDEHSLVNPAPIVERLDVWFPKDARQRMLWSSSVQLSEQFFESVRQHALPLDMRALRTLKHSALALDLYTWLAHRLPRVRKREGDFISWTALHAQFGPDVVSRKTFKNNMRTALTQTLLTYRDARVLRVAGGLLLKASRPPIPKIRQRML